MITVATDGIVGDKLDSSGYVTKKPKDEDIEIARWLVKTDDIKLLKQKASMWVW